MAEDILACSIEIEDEWIQEGCHWNYDRLIVFTYKTISLESLIKTSFAYSVDGGNTYTAVTPDLVKNCATYRIYSYEVRLSDLTRPANGILEIRAKLTFLGEEKITSYDYDWDLAPSSSTLAVKLNRINADRIECSWDRPTDIEDSPSLAGYCIELFCKEKDTNDYVQISDIAFETDQEGKYKLARKTGTLSVINYDELPEDITNTEITFEGQGTSYEAYLQNPAIESFYFRPRDFEVTPGNIVDKDDFFKIKVYPYIVYGCYLEDGCANHGGYLSSKGDESDETKFTLGVVRVKTNKGWQEGQVWVKTSTGWKEADAIYTKTADGWKEAIS